MPEVSVATRSVATRSVATRSEDVRIHRHVECVDDQLPLSESVAYVLITLKDGEAKHGGAIGKLVKRLSNGQVDIAPGNLYPMLTRLRKNGLLEIADETDDEGTARKLYRITGMGQQVLSADQVRLRQRARAAASIPTLKPVAGLVSE